MNAFEISLLVVGAILLGVITYCFVKNKNYLEYSNIFTPALRALYSLLVTIGNASPKNEKLLMFSTIVRAAIEAAGCAENLWLQGELDKEKRHEYAKEFITIILHSAGIEMTESIEVIIEGAIAATCFLLPHYTQKEA
jgi:hypothetical protein